MSFVVWPLILIGLSFVGAAFVIVRHLPQLSILDVENLPEFKEQKKKEDVIKKRIEEKAGAAKRVRAVQIEPILKILKQLQLRFRKFVGNVQQSGMRIKEAGFSSHKSVVVDTDALSSCLKSGNQLREQGDLSAAEERYIAAIRIDPKCRDAYRGLGEVYFQQGHTSEAKETLTFLHQLDPNDDAALVKLAEIFENEGNKEKAVQYLEQAILLNDNIASRFSKLAELLVSIEEYNTAAEAIKQASDLEPENPKYLDTLVEVSILVGDKAGAERAMQALRRVNPDNQKLAIFKDKIATLN